MYILDKIKQDILDRNRKSMEAMANYLREAMVKKASTVHSTYSKEKVELVDSDIEMSSEESKDKVTFRVGVDENKVPTIPYIILGTRNTPSQDFISEAYKDSYSNFIEVYKKEFNR